MPGRALGVLGAPPEASPAAWAAAGRTIRRLHESPLSPWPGRALAGFEEELERECEWLLEHGFDPDAPGCEFDVLRARMGEKA